MDSRPSLVCPAGPDRRPARARSAASRAGFTLLEAMVALAILGTGVAAVLGLLASGVSVTQRTQTRVLVTELAQERLESLLLGEPDGAGDGEAQGRYEEPYGAFRWRTRVAPGRVPGTRLVEVSVAGEGDSVHLATLRFR
ncbi:MAG TPA: prepilin-type N-terminal cleavage/methylation domain-containing protein [Longimicrobiaceae bacterium]|nr:prepilin-type N-terminal cleavage/methylation domain-containing protein [Longimicrobiaceae bacterium]